jgi:N utilization substance protein A
MSQEIIEGIHAIEKEKGIEEGILISALEDALLAAYKKTPGAARHAEVKLDEEGEFRVDGIQIPSDVEVRLLEDAREARIAELEKVEEETGERQHTLIADDDLDLDWSQVPSDQIVRTDVTPENFGRIAAQTAKQVIQQRIREAERAIMYEEYVDRQGEVVTGIVQQAGDRNNVLVDLGRVEALLPRSEQVDGERYEQGSRIKAVIAEVRSGTKGPQVILSRRDPELIRALFELEVPEIADGLVEIRGVAREPGYRSKIAVESHMQGVDPVGACVGPRGSRVRMVVSELRGEKIDIIPWNTEPARFVAKALSPARVREVYIDDETREATVIVPDDQLALAIGKEGLNARLATRLTGWKIDIQSESEFARAEAAAAFAGASDDEEYSGRCAAVLSNGKRCPNAALPGSRYCGVPGHQALAAKEPAVAEAPVQATDSVEELTETAAEAPEETPVAVGEPGVVEAAGQTAAVVAELDRTDSPSERAGNGAPAEAVSNSDDSEAGEETPVPVGEPGIAEAAGQASAVLAELDRPDSPSERSGDGGLELVEEPTPQTAEPRREGL